MNNGRAPLFGWSQDPAPQVGIVTRFSGRCTSCFTGRVLPQIMPSARPRQPYRPTVRQDGHAKDPVKVQLQYQAPTTPSCAVVWNMCGEMELWCVLGPVPCHVTVCPLNRNFCCRCTQWANSVSVPSPGLRKANKPVSQMLGPSCSGASRPKRQPCTMIGSDASCAEFPAAEDAPAVQSAWFSCREQGTPS